MRDLLRWAAAALFFALPAQAPAAHKVAPQPAFVVADPVPATGDAALGKDGTRYLVASDQVDTTGPRPVRYRHVSYIVESERGLSDGGRFSIVYQPDYQEVSLHRVDVVRDGVAHDRLGAIQVQDLRREQDLESAILDGEHTLDVTIPDVQVGDRVDYSYSIEGTNPVFGDAYFARFIAAYSDPVGLRRVRATWTAARPLHWRVGRDGMQVRSGAVGDARFVDIAATAVPRVREENGAPPGFDPYGRIELGTAADWSEIVRWALPLYAARFGDPGVAARMREKLRLDDPDRLAVLARAIAFVQGEIRYTALDMGENSHAPNPPETTLARRFGDCKDKAVLLLALLAEAGIEADPVLVDTTAGAYLAGRMPSALAFDHVVVRASSGGREYWIDATRDREQGPLAARDPLPFALGLPVCAGCKALVEIPAPMPATPRVAVTERIDVTTTADGYVAAFGVVTDYRGLRAAQTRGTFEDEGAAEMGRRYLGYMRGFYEGIDAVGLPEVDPPGAAGGLRTRERYRLAWKRSEAHVFGVVLFQLLDFVPSLEAGERHAPMALSGPRFATHVVRMSIPMGWSITPEHDEVRTAQFILRRDVRVVDGLLEVRAEWRRLADEIPAAQHAQAREALSRARDLLEYDIDLDTRPLAGALEHPRAWAWPALAWLIALAAVALAWCLRMRSRLAGMLFRPSATMASILDAPAQPERAWLLLLAMAACESAITLVPDQVGKGAAFAWMVGGFGTPALVLRLVLYTAILGWTLRVVRVPRPEFDRMLASTAWGGSPAMLLFSLLGLLALRGRVGLLADGRVPSPEEAPAVVAAGALIAVGSVWGVLNALCAHAVAARCTRWRIIAAWLLLVLVAALLLGGALWLARF